MPINPITVTRLKTFVVLGHSNADGWAPTDWALGSPHTYLLPGVNSAQSVKSNPADAWYKNCYVATSAQPYPAQVADGANAPVASDVGDVEWLELTVANTQTPNDPHPHPSPYQFPNNQGACYPHYLYNSFSTAWTTFNATPADVAWLGTRSGVELPLMWLWRTFWNEQVGMVKMAFSSSFMMPNDLSLNSSLAAAWLDTFSVSEATPSDPNYVRSSVYTNPTTTPADPAGFGTPYDSLAWWTPTEHFDFSINTDRLYKKWYDRMVGAAAALPTGTKLDVQLVVLWMGDNEALRGTTPLLQGFEKHAAKMIDKMRADLVANDWTTLPPDQIPIVIPGAHAGYPSAIVPGYDSVSVVNNAYDNIIKRDEMVRRLDSNSWSTLADEGISLLGNIPGPANHFGADGYKQAANDIMNAWVDMRGDYFDALDEDEVKTVRQTIDQVKLYYAKNRSSTDLTDAIVLQHMNGAMYHVFNHVGDNAWWLRRRMSLAITTDTQLVATMPRYVKRLLRIEHPSDPTYPLSFEQIGHVQQGRLQILMKERGSGTYICHFITNPRELSRDNQIVPAPRQILEWIVVETCRRMAGASNTTALMAHFAGEAAQLMVDCMRNSGQTQRSKNDVMRTQRRRPRFGYGRGPRSTWWGADY